MTLYTSFPGELSLGRLAESGDWRSLTAVDQKYRYFSAETYFRESWDIASDELGPAALSGLQRIAMLALKPECVVGRKGEKVLEYMRQNGFRQAVAQPFRYDRHRTREIWRFQWNIATIDRVQLGDLLHTASDSLLVVFVDERAGEHASVPGSVRLAGLKGSSLPSERGPEHLRTHLAALNRMIVFVHCSDEPVDIVRELGILFAPAELRDLYRRIRGVLSGREGDDVPAALSALYERSPAHSLDVDAAVRRVRAGLRQDHGWGAGTARRAEQALVAAASGGGTLDWRTWAADIASIGHSPAAWDEILVATQYILHDRPGVRCIVSESGRERWLAGEGHRPAL